MQRNGVGLRHILAGLQAGVTGTLVMWTWFAISCLWTGRSFWVIPNIFATTFCGVRAYSGAFLPTGFIGLSLMIAFFGLGGVIWAVLCRDSKSPVLPLLGVIYGAVVYYLAAHYFWPKFNPLIGAYIPERQLQIAHVLWGWRLAKSPAYARVMAAGSARVGEVIV